MHSQENHPERQEHEAFLGNVNLKENDNALPRKLQHIKSMRLGKQAYDSKGNPINICDYSPLFINKEELPLYGAWLEERHVIEQYRSIPKEFSLQGSSARNPDKIYGGEVFYERHKRAWAYVPFNSLIKGGDGFSTPEEAFEAFSKAVEKYKELKHWSMTKSEWAKLSSDYKGIDGKGKKSAMRNINGASVIVPVTIID